MPQKDSAEKAVRDIRRKTRRKFADEENIQIVLGALSRGPCEPGVSPGARGCPPPGCAHRCGQARSAARYSSRRNKDTRRDRPRPREHRAGRSARAVLATVRATAWCWIGCGRHPQRSSRCPRSVSRPRSRPAGIRRPAWCGSLP